MATVRAKTLIQNLKCLLIQLLLEVLCICQNQQKATTSNDQAGITKSSDKLNIDYTRVFTGVWLSQKGFAFEQEIVQFIHSILVEEELVIEQLHRQTYPLEVVEIVVKEVKSI